MWSSGRVAAEVTLQEVRDAHLRYALYCAGNDLYDGRGSDLGQAPELSRTQPHRGLFVGSEFHVNPAADWYGNVEDDYGDTPAYYPAEELVKGDELTGARSLPPVAIFVAHPAEDFAHTQLTLSVAERLLSHDVPIVWCALDPIDQCSRVLHVAVRHAWQEEVWRSPY